MLGPRRRTRTASTSARSPAATRIGVTATGDVDALLAHDADCVVYSPIFADPSVVTRHPRVGQERGHAARLVLPTDADDATASTPSAGRAGRDAARHRHPPRRHHRALPADDLGAVGLDHPRARRGVLRHPHLRRPRRGPGLDALRQDARGGPHEHHGRRPRGRLPASRCGWWPTSSASTSTRSCAPPTTWPWPPPRSTRPSAPSSPGTVAAQRFRWEGLVDGEPVVTAAVNWLMGEDDLDPPWALRPRGRALRGRGHGRPELLLTFKGLHPHSIEEGLAPQPRHRRHGHALRQRGALRLRRGTRGC